MSENNQKFLNEEVKKMGFAVIPCEDDPTGRYYIELPDGYRLIYDSNGYVGRYDPNMSETI